MDAKLSFGKINEMNAKDFNFSLLRSRTITYDCTNKSNLMVVVVSEFRHPMTMSCGIVALIGN